MIAGAENRRPIRILEFTSASASGGGPDKTILLGSARADPERFDITVCYLRHCKDEAFDIEDRARALGLKFVAIEERGKLDLAAWSAVRRLVRDRRIDIVHSHGYKADLITLLVARKEGVIPLSTVHGFTGHTWREKLLYYPGDRRILARFPAVISVSSQLRDTLVKAGVRPGRIHTILNGIDHRRFRRNPDRSAEFRSALGLGPGEVAIGGVGRVERQKRFDVLLDAFATLLPQQPQLRLFIVGDGGLRAALESHAERLGVADACRFLDYRTDMDRVYQALDVFVQSSDYEGTPNVVLEAMAFETPIVATDVGGTAELIHDQMHGLLVPRRDPERLADAILQTLEDKSATQQRVAAARARVEGELSFDARMRAVDRVYEELMVRYGRWTLPQALPAGCAE